MSQEPESTVARLLALGMERHRAGDLQGAAEAYRAVPPDSRHQPDALHLLGLVAHASGDAAGALDLLGRAVAARPDDAAFHNDLGGVLESLGRLDEAAEAYRRSLAIDAGDADGWFNLGLALLRAERGEDAVPALERAVGLRPADAEAWLELGRAQEATGRLPDAETAYRRAAAHDTAPRGATLALASVVRRLGRPEEAVDLLLGDLARHGEDAGVLNNLGNALRDVGRPAEAARHLARACALAPQAAECHANHALALRDCRDLAGACAALRRAAAVAPDPAPVRRLLAVVLRQARDFEQVDLDEAELLACLATPGVEAQDLARAAAASVRATHGMGAGAAAPPAAALLDALARDRLLIALLGSAINVDPVLESYLELARAALLARGTGGGALPEVLEELACALGLQGFANEYLLGESPVERERVDGLVERLRSATTASVDDALLVAMYRPLAQLPAAEALAAAQGWPAAAAPLVERTLHEPLEERRIAAALESLAPVTDGVSRAVRDQYEANPYPRWLSPPPGDGEGLAAALVRRFPDVALPEGLDDRPGVLIAGCGTGYETLEIAGSCPDARITAIDLSRASLAYAARMARRLGVAHVRFAHGDLLDVGVLAERFPLVVSSGVLHHMDDPMAGWRALLGRLAPRGIMRIGLYSERARGAVVAARELIAREGLEATPAGIRELRRRILDGAVPAEMRPLATSDDLFSTSGCRDLLFHVHEHRFTVLGVRDALRALGLRFLGFELDDAQVRAAYRESFPDDPQMRDLDNWDRFEAAHPGTFTGMFQFWCQRSG